MYFALNRLSLNKLCDSVLSSISYDILEALFIYIKEAFIFTPYAYLRVLPCDWLQYSTVCWDLQNNSNTVLRFMITSVRTDKFILEI